MVFFPQWTQAAATPAATAATGTAASPAPRIAAAPPKLPPKPPEPPPSVPDNVNPFADETSLPQPLKWPGAARPRIDIDVHPVQFDGLTLLLMSFKGPDFEWQFEPLGDFTPAVAGGAESAAFIYQPNSALRLSWALYGRTELLPDYTPASVVQYLAAMRAPSPKNFVLLTPITKDMKFIQPDSLCGFQTQSVEYAIVSATEVTIHHDWFLDLNHEYLLVVSLTGPPALVEKLKPTLHFFLARSRILKGLGVKEEKADQAPAKPAASSSNT